MQPQGNRWYYQDSTSPFDSELQQVYGWCRPCRHAPVTLQFNNHVPEPLVAEIVFYLLDVGTSNALVLYNESAKMRTPTDGTYKPMNIVDFKMQLVEGLVGRLIDSQSGQEEMVEHIPVHIQGEVRSRCAYCALLSRTRRTRYKCLGCGVPLCSALCNS